jgi:hypothetical protein
MRSASAWHVVCPCSATVEWPDHNRCATCPKCGRILEVAAFPNDALMTVAAPRSVVMPVRRVEIGAHPASLPQSSSIVKTERLRNAQGEMEACER